ncbi:MAG: FAD-dependent oxidoreductase [Candidatus Izemoplasma sp.]|nr:FAD-dependent oxidoreductase [Candidatus Izemoplasma sp.]
MGSPENYDIALKHKKRVQDRYTVFEFERPDGFTFTPGQYGVFKHINKAVNGRKVRAFSLAMKQDEDLIRIATRIEAPVSDFKQHLDALTYGDKLTMQAPVGNFTIVDPSPAVFLVGGIGITPVYSMALSHPVLDKTLVYSELDHIYPFKEELEQIDHLTIHYTSGVEPTQHAIKEVVNTHSDALYYVVGSPNFVNGIKAFLNELGVNPKQIFNDSFSGY